ncbi:MAG: hypothetical protein ILO10_00060 [Kiritimatiellae bacterium]|nr:hypothetical protein [Kiritimatiellia bacterium]
MDDSDVRQAVAQWFRFAAEADVNPAQAEAIRKVLAGQGQEHAGPLQKNIGQAKG